MEGILLTILAALGIASGAEFKNLSVEKILPALGYEPTIVDLPTYAECELTPAATTVKISAVQIEDYYWVSHLKLSI